VHLGLICLDCAFDVRILVKIIYVRRYMQQSVCLRGPSFAVHRRRRFRGGAHKGGEEMIIKDANLAYLDLDSESHRQAIAGETFSLIILNKLGNRFEVFIFGWNV